MPDDVATFLDTALAPDVVLPVDVVDGAFTELDVEVVAEADVAPLYPGTLNVAEYVFP